MRYLRMLSNSLVGGAIAAAYLTILVLHLNPGLSLRLSNLAPLYVALELTYGLQLAVVFYVLNVFRQLIAMEVDSPAWVSFGVLTWLCTAAAGASAALMWMNRRTFGPMVPADTVRHLTAAAFWMTACAGLFLVLGLVHFSFGRRGGRVAGGLFFLALAASLSLPIAARGIAPPPPVFERAPAVKVGPAAGATRPRVMMILLDGASLNFISLAAADGRLLNLGRMLDSGASMYLETLRPTQPGPVWTAVATGKLPAKNGVRAAARYRAGASEEFDLLPDYCFSHGLVRLGVLTERPHTSASLRAMPFWEILSRLDISVGIVGWPLSQPVHPLRGYIVSDQLRFGDVAIGSEDPSAMYPIEAAPMVRAAFDAQESDEGSVTNVSLANADRPTIIRYLFGRDQLYQQVSDALRRSENPQLAAVRYRGLDRAGHEFLRYADPASFGDVTEEERRSLGHVLTSAYSVVDAAVGDAMKSLGPDDLLLVVSAFGMQPLGLGKRMLERALGNAELSGTHEGGPDGFMLAYGASVQPGRRMRGAVVDLAPTLLYFFGLPVGRDMDGHARTDIFRQSFTAERPITFIQTYESRAPKAGR